MASDGPFRGLLERGANLTLENRRQIESVSEYLRLVADEATWVWKRCQADMQRNSDLGQPNQIHEIAPFHFLYTITRAVDAIQILVSECAIAGAIPIVRSEWESYVNLKALLSDPDRLDERCRAWLAAYIHGRQKAYRGILDHVEVRPDREPGLRREQARLEAYARQEPIRRVYEKLAGLPEHQRQWYRLAFDEKTSSIYALADRVGLKQEYVGLYADWSSMVHEGALHRIMRSDVPVNSIENIRGMSQLKEVALAAGGYALDAIVMMLNQYRPGEDIRKLSRFPRILQLRQWVSGIRIVDRERE